MRQRHHKTQNVVYLLVCMPDRHKQCVCMCMNLQPEGPDHNSPEMFGAFLFLLNYVTGIV